MQDLGICQGVFQVFGAEVFRLYKMMGWRWESFGSGLEALGQWVGSNHWPLPRPIITYTVF